MINIKPVPSHLIEDYWPHIETYLDRVYARTLLALTTPKPFLKQGLKDSHYQAWVGLEEVDGFYRIRGVGITTLLDYPGGKTCLLFAAADDEHSPDWEAYLSGIEKWAKEVENCVAIMVSGRKGWERQLRAAGYEFDCINLIKRFNDDESND